MSAESKQLEKSPRVIVLGGGIAGVNAALTLADEMTDKGEYVLLIEQSAELLDKTSNATPCRPSLGAHYPHTLTGQHSLETVCDLVLTYEEQGGFLAAADEKPTHHLRNCDYVVANDSTHSPQEVEEILKNLQKKYAEILEKERKTHVVNEYARMVNEEQPHLLSGYENIIKNCRDIFERYEKISAAQPAEIGKCEARVKKKLMEFRQVDGQAMKQRGLRRFFGEPENFWRKLKPSEYPGSLNIATTAAVFRIPEHIMDWPRYREFLINKVESHPNIVIRLNTSARKITKVPSNTPSGCQYTVKVDDNNKVEDFTGDFVVTAAWNAAAQLTESILLPMDEKPAPVENLRLKAMVKVKNLPKEFKEMSHQFRCFGGKAGVAVSFTPKGEAFVTCEEFTNIWQGEQGQLPEKMVAYLNRTASKEDVNGVAREILAGAARKAYPGIDRGEIEGVKFGLVITDGGKVDIDSKEGPHTERSFTGVTQHNLGYVSNQARKHIYGLPNAKKTRILYQIFKEFEQTMAKGFSGSSVKHPRLISHLYYDKLSGLGSGRVFDEKAKQAEYEGIFKDMGEFIEKRKKWNKGEILNEARGRLKKVEQPVAQTSHADPLPSGIINAIREQPQTKPENQLMNVQSKSARSLSIDIPLRDEKLQQQQLDSKDVQPPAGNINSPAHPEGVEATSSPSSALLSPYVMLSLPKGDEKRQQQQSGSKDVQSSSVNINISAPQGSVETTSAPSSINNRGVWSGQSFIAIISNLWKLKDNKQQSHSKVRQNSISPTSPARELISPHSESSASLSVSSTPSLTFSTPSSAFSTPSLTFSTPSSASSTPLLTFSAPSPGAGVRSLTPLSLGSARREQPETPQVTTFFHPSSNNGKEEPPSSNPAERQRIKPD